MCGSCPYRDRCQYIHDYRILCSNARSKTRKKVVAGVDEEEDSFFWPTMLSSKNQSSGMSYEIMRERGQERAQDKQIVSMWATFSKFCDDCNYNRELNVFNINQPTHANSDVSRLDVFMTLSQGNSISDDHDQSSNGVCVSHERDWTDDSSTLLSFTSFEDEKYLGPFTSDIYCTPTRHEIGIDIESPTGINEIPDLDEDNVLHSEMDDEIIKPATNPFSFGAFPWETSIVRSVPITPPGLNTTHVLSSKTNTNSISKNDDEMTHENEIGVNIGLIDMLDEPEEESILSRAFIVDPRVSLRHDERRRRESGRSLFD